MLYDATVAVHQMTKKGMKVACFDKLVNRVWLELVFLCSLLLAGLHIESTLYRVGQKTDCF